MSITTGDFGSKTTASTLLEKKQRQETITCLTAYDYPSARQVDEAGIDMILVGDSLGMVMLGYENTLPVTMQEMLHHTRAVRRGVKHAFLIAAQLRNTGHSLERREFRVYLCGESSPIEYRVEGDLSATQSPPRGSWEGTCYGHLEPHSTNLQLLFSLVADS